MSDLKITNSQIDDQVFQDKLAKLKIEYDNADRLARDVQSFVKKAGIPAINELRYAGHHLLLSLTEPETSSELELDRAISHCQRASYDASEAGVFVAFKKIEQFKDDYAKIPIVDVVSDWIEVLANCDSAREAIIESRQRGEDRAVDYRKHKKNFDALSATCARLDHARVELNKVIEARAASGRKTACGLVLAATGIVVAILIAVLQN